METEKKKNTLALFVFGCLFIVAIVAVVVIMNNQNSNESAYNDALKKCAVMEAADIYTTGVGNKSGNSFDDGKASCENMLKTTFQGDKNEFIKVIGEDWSNRKSETIEDKSLEHYYSVLNW